MSGSEPLAGGNSTAVVRIGDTVRRTSGPWTATVHALLRHLRANGVTEVPEPFGLDAEGREILSYRPGVVAGYPLPDWLWAPGIIDQAGSLLRRITMRPRGSYVPVRSGSCRATIRPRWSA